MTRPMNESAPGGAQEGSWSVPVSLHDVPLSGRHFALAADEATRAAIAKAAGLRALPRLEATFDVTRLDSGGLHVVGRVVATVGQLCVVSLDPIENEVDESVDLTFVPGAAAAPGSDALSVADEAPEPLRGDTIDLGAIATEFLILGIDLYPRKPDAIFNAPAVEDETEHPFAALAALRGGQGGREE
jgi:uncharacterized metal-binding protein YceD (DUF177 family)